MAATDTQIPAEKIETYRKVRVLAEEGATPGERASAQRIAANLEAKYPGIREAAARDTKRPSVKMPSWTDIAAFAVQAFGSVQSWLDAVAAEVDANHVDDTAREDIQVICDAIEVSAKVNKAGALTFVFKLDGDVMDALSEVVGEDKAVLAAAADTFATIAKRAFLETLSIDENDATG